jgi:iron complex outermembrane recepter protein
VLAAGIALCGGAAPALAQRANENAVTQAGDAFGTSVGNERIGIYNPFSARGFSPVQAGNVRIEGLYFDLQAELDNRLVSGANVRVGISAQSYPFSAPSGIADYSIRKAGDEAVLSAIATVGSFGPTSISADAQLPVSDRFSVAAGAGYLYDATHWGADRNFVNAALIPRWRPTDSVEVVPFVSWFLSSGTEAQPIYFPAGSYLPPQIQRREYFGPSWAQSEAEGLNYGLLSSFTSGRWVVRGGLFSSELSQDRSFTEIALNMTPDGLADRYLAREGDRRFASRSGELRISRSLTEGPRLHTLHFALRGREQRRRYGGGQSIPLGRRFIDEEVELPEPEFAVGPQTRDRVRQFTYGLGYEGRWRDVGELSLSVQQTNYRKNVETPGGLLPVSRASPLLLNGTASVHLSRAVSVYAGYARGLEESPIAPTIAINRDEAPPAIITEQMDAGVRIVLPRNLRLVAGLFDVTKPYFGLDNQLFFGRLGEVRHRGVEISLAGSPLPGLTAVIGTVFLDARLSGTAVDQGLVGERPVGTFVRYTNAALDYRLPFLEGVSVDIAYESTSDRVADRLNTFVIPARFVLALGGRYRFQLAGRPATLRAQVTNIFGNYGWNNVGEGFHYNVPRRLSLSLSTDV